MLAVEGRLDKKGKAGCIRLSFADNAREARLGVETLARSDGTISKNTCSR